MAPLKEQSFMRPLLSLTRRMGIACLPNELLRQIFKHATYVQSGYDTHLISPFDFSELTDGYNAFLERLKISHSTKQSIRLVSRTWRALSHDLIFEYMFLRDNFSWSTLAEGLESIAPIAGVTGSRSHGMGWYVKRVEISASEWTESLANDAARVVRACPNLKVVSVGSDDESPVPYVLVSAVLETCPKSLRALDWTCGLDSDSLTRVMCGVGAMSELRTLFLCIEMDLLPHELPETVALPKLHTLELVSSSTDPSDVLETMSDWFLPALRQVTITGQAELSEPGPFFWAHGSKLKTLEFDYAGELQIPPEGVSPLEFDPTSGPEVLLLNCPDLSELILSLHWAQLQASPGHQNVTSIGLRGLHLLSHKQAHSSARNPVTGAMMLRPEQDFEQQTAITALEHLFPLLLSSISTPLSECVDTPACRYRPDPSTSNPGSPSSKAEKDRDCICRSPPQLSLFPSLKVVRLLDFDQARFGEIPWRAKRVAFWRIWVKRFEEKGVRLEDHCGELVRVNFHDVRVYLPEDEREWKMQMRKEMQRIASSRIAAAAVALPGPAPIVLAAEPPVAPPQE